ncbi:MAG: magnesium transporter [Treponema sp.]|nr:magnesium transporter [Treponema sp.]MCL2236807.1 magnesium transporter [Treponema sp.]
MDKEEIIELIREGSLSISKLKIFLSDMNTVDIAEILGELDGDKIIQMFRILPKAIASDVFSYIDTDHQQAIIETLTDSEVGDIINTLFVDDAVDFIEEMPASVVKRVLQHVPFAKRKIINQILQYPDDSAGSIMTTEYIDLREDTKVKEAFDTIRTIGLNKETIYNCYVIRKDRLLVGGVSAKTLMLSKPQDKIASIMDADIAFAYTTDDREIVVDLFKKYNLLAMPVVDKEQRLVGIITVDDIVDVIVEESTEDIEKMAAIVPSDETYLKTTIFQHARNRFLWMLILMLSATITGTIISSFEKGLMAIPILMAFIPMLMNTGGIAGSQSSTLIIRGMAVGEIDLKDILIILWKELRVAVLCGLGLGLVNFIRVLIMNNNDWKLCLTITVSLFCTICMAKTVGGVLPIFAKRLKIDPAIMSAPLLTTIVDAVSLIIYFSFAKLIFGL